MAKAEQAVAGGFLLSCGHSVGALFDGQKIKLGSKVECRACQFHAGAAARAAKRRAQAAEAAAKEVSG